MMDKDILLLRLNEKWNCTLPFGWIPITSSDDIPNTEIFKSDYLNYYMGEIKNIISNIFDLNALFEIREDGQFKVVNIAECEFSYDGTEYIYTDEDLTFVLYFSHENSTTVGGESLLNEIHKIWPDYSIHLWKSSWS
jgi:hypothetical protein